MMEFTGERFIPNVSIDSEIATEHLQRYYSIVGAVKGKVVLDAACGEGYGSYILARNAKAVYGLDIDEPTICHAAETYIVDNLSYITGSIANLPFEDSSIDVVISFETIEHVNQELQESFLKEVQRVLTPHGILVISTPNKAVYSELHNHVNHFHVREFYYGEFKQFLGSFFRNVSIYNQRFNVSSVISNEASRELEVLRLDGVHSETTKYIIAICGNDSDLVNISLDTVVLDSKNRYEGFIKRIVELQKEEDERNKHIQRLDKEIKAKSDRILELQTEVEERNKWVKSLEAEIGSSREDSNQNVGSFTKDFLQERLAYEQTIENQKGHIEQLLERERMLERILHSNGWKVLNDYYRFRDVLLPSGSMRRIYAIILFKFLKHPKIMSKMINVKNIRKAIYYRKSSSGSFLENKVTNYLDSHIESGNTPLRLYDSSGQYEHLSFPKEENPTVSIIIPVYNQWNYTYSCLCSILDNSKGVSYEVIIADDLSTDETINIKEYVDNVRVIRDNENRGFLLNCNNAAKFAKGDFILFLNNDTNVQNDWLAPLLNLIQSDNKIGMVGSKLVYSDRRLQEAGGIIWNDASGWNYGRLDDPEKPEYNYVKQVDYISGASIMIQKSLWAEIGGFDEQYAPAYFEDSDLAFEVRKRGYKVVYQPKSVVVHFEGISHGTDTRIGIKKYQLENKNKFVQKWGNVLAQDHFANSDNLFCARDRTKDKKVILVIDHYVPHYDKDAGSRTVFQYLKLFVKMGLNIKFIGDNLFRHEPYTSELQSLGIEVIYGHWYEGNIFSWIKDNGQYFDYVYLNRPHISTRYIDTIRQHSKAKILYYGHDLHYLREKREYELTSNEALLKSSQKWHSVEADIIKKSDVVYYPSQVEVDAVKYEFPSAVVRAVPAYLYNLRGGSQCKKAFAERRDILFVGGFGHKPNVDAVLWFAEHIFSKILEEIPDLRFCVAGSNPPDEISALESSQIKVTGYITEDELKNYYRNCRLVVAPLRYGAGVKGKIIEAMYYGTPVVTTSIGAEGIPEAENYLTICDEPDDYARAVVTEYNNIEKLELLSGRYKDYIQSYFSPDAALRLLKLDIGIE